MTREELEQLRHEARGFLDNLQALPGFGERRAALEAVPPSVRSLRFWRVREFGRAGEIRAVGWRYWDPDDEPFDSETIKASKRLQDEGYRVVVEQRDGSRTLRMPDWMPLPEDTESRDAVDRYRTEIERFAQRVLLGACWGASALHDALRSDQHDQLIVLPAAAPEGWVVPPIEFPITLSPDQPVPREDLRSLASALASVAADPGKPELGRSRTATWTGALEAVSRELAGGKLTGTDRSHRSRARMYLDAAVNGTVNLDEPSDWMYRRDPADKT